MPVERHKAEEIINKLRQADVELGRGKSLPSVCKAIGVTEATYYRWRREYGGKRVERIWRREGLKVPSKQPKRGRLWLNDGSCVRLRAERRYHVWAYDFVQATHDGRAFRMLVIVDEFTRECLAIDVARRLCSEDVLERLSWLMAIHVLDRDVKLDTLDYGAADDGRLVLTDGSGFELEIAEPSFMR